MPERILIADDEQYVLQAMMRRLQRRGYDVAGAQSGGEALDKLAVESFDLLLVDIKMPGMSGLELLRRAREMAPDIMALILTGYGNVENAAEAMELGALGFVQKPVASDELATAIDSALARGRLGRENARLRALMPLFELSRVLLSEVEEGRLLDLMMEVVVEELDAVEVAILLRDDAGNLVKREAGGVASTEEGSAAYDELAIEAATRLEPIVVPAASAGSAVDAEAGPQPEGYRVYVPLVVRGEAVGVVRVARAADGRAFRESDIEFLCTLCGQGATALANARLFESVQQKQAQVEALLQEVISTAEKERMALAMDLHDGPVQSITASHYEMQACVLLIGQGRLDEAVTKLAEVQSVMTSCVRSLRGIVRDLSPPSPIELGLIRAVREYLDSLHKTDGIDAQLEVVGEAVALGGAIEREVYYVIREALTNVRKHTEGANVRVRIEFSVDELRVTISDDGKGFDVAVGRRGASGHMGIRSMQERARLLRGDLVIESEPGEGTQVRLVLPVDSAPPVESKGQLSGYAASRRRRVASRDDVRKG